MISSGCRASVGRRSFHRSSLRYRDPACPILSATPACSPGHRVVRLRPARRRAGPPRRSADSQALPTPAGGQPHLARRGSSHLSRGVPRGTKHRPPRSTAATPREAKTLVGPSGTPLITAGRSRRRRRTRRTVRSTRSPPVDELAAAPSADPQTPSAPLAGSTEQPFPRTSTLARRTVPRTARSRVNE
jgi:hypothetical protein